MPVTVLAENQPVNARFYVFESFGIWYIIDRQAQRPIAHCGNADDATTVAHTLNCHIALRYVCEDVLSWAAQSPAARAARGPELAIEDAHKAARILKANPKSILA